MTTAMTRPIFHEYEYAVSPAIDNMMKISSGEYATLDSGSLANTGSAIRLDSSVSPSCALRSFRPSMIRLPASVTLMAPPTRDRPEGHAAARHSAFIVPGGYRRRKEDGVKAALR